MDLNYKRFVDSFITKYNKLPCLQVLMEEFLKKQWTSGEWIMMLKDIEIYKNQNYK
ncbi:hypothetical protein LG296_20485 (plasmid) [Ureibacillus chungkukjangi]|uniref:hypothetical protein n=1 Tax=Ureibacillus chungkukjangi TaxID=1202712 RepID=UPI00187D2802|nr:hypothetical protein [Ureibacillus chungkukjangi]MCM3390426.1 hypothetical protein [Ureibacillus chungkukjangi]